MKADLSAKNVLLYINAFWILSLQPLESLWAQGALGIQFGAAIDIHLISEPLEVVTAQYAPQPPPGISYTLRPHAPAHLRDQWFTLIPKVVPRILQERTVGYQVQINEQLQAIRLVARVQLEQNCNELTPALTGILDKKYSTVEAIARRPNYAHHGQFESGAMRIDLHCSDSNRFLLLEYSDPVAVMNWFNYQASEINTWTAEQKRKKNLRIAQSISMGNPKKLLGGYTILFDNPILGLKSFEADQATKLPSSLVETQVKVEIAADEYRVLLSPDSKPYKITGIYRFESQIEAIEKMREIFEALSEKYGKALKNRPRHKIFNVSSDYIVERFIPPASFELTFIQREGIRLQRKRKQAATELKQNQEAARLLSAQKKAEMEARIAKDRKDEEQRRWNESTMGL